MARSFALFLLLALLACLPATASESPSVVRPWTGQDSLRDLARRYGVTERDLRGANPGLDSPVPPESITVPAPPGGWPRHVVSRGETLWALSRRYDVPVEELRQANSLSGDGLKAGQELAIPRADLPAPEAGTLPAPQATLPGGPPLWLAVTLPDGRRGWVPGSAVVLPSPDPLPRQAVVDLAARLRGTPYRFGGTTPDAVDCSGFIQEVYRMAGHRLPRLADEQFAATRPVATEALEPGDLVFFSTYLPGPSHVGIYLGQGRFLHASSSRGVTDDALDSQYFSTRFLGGRRLEAWTPAENLVREPGEPPPGNQEPDAPPVGGSRPGS